MQVLSNDQIGHTLQTRARAHSTRVRTSNQSMNIAFDVPEGSGTVGKSNRQDLPIQVHKADREQQGRRPSGYDGSPMVLGPEYQNARPSGGDENTIPTPGNWEAAQADFDSYFRNTDPGTVTPFAGGTLTMGNDGYARYSGPNGSTSTFNANDPLRDIAIGNQDIRNAWGQKYGLGIMGPTGAYYMPFGETVPADSTPAIIVPANTGGTGITVADSYQGPGTGTGSGMSPAVVNKPLTSPDEGYIDASGTAGPGPIEYPTSVGGDGNTIATSGDPHINRWPSDGSYGNTMTDPYIQTWSNMSPTAAQPSEANKDYGLLTGEDAVSRGLGKAYGLMSKYTPSAYPFDIPSQAKAPSSQNYMNATTDVRIKLTDQDVVC
jgi:hypothetical protein